MLAPVFGGDWGLGGVAEPPRRVADIEHRALLGLLRVVRFFGPDRPHGVTLEPWHQVDMKVLDRLRRGPAVGLDDVEPFRVHGVSDRIGEQQCRPRELGGLVGVECPDVRDVPTRHHQHVTEDSGLCREEGDHVFVPVHLSDVRVVAVDNLAELAALAHHMRTFAWATQLSKLFTSAE